MINRVDIQQNGFCRKVTEYKDNCSIALSFQMSSDEIRKNLSAPEVLLSAAQEQIKEHAARRVEIFFYILVAYYKKNRSPIQGDTQLQHGRGRRIKKKIGLTHACHSSFFSSFIDSNGKGLLEDTHFYDNMNSTMELPLFVNNLDCQLEGKIAYPSNCRKASLAILQQVSKGELDPLQGLRQFLKLINDTFNDLEAYLARDSVQSPKLIKSKLIALEKEGSLKGKWLAETNEVTEDYINLLLRLNPAEKLNTKQKNKLYLRKIKSIQQEILTTKSQSDFKRQW